MSASSNMIWRGMRRLLQALHFVAPRPNSDVAIATSALIDPATAKLTATIEIIALLDDVREIEIDLVEIEQVAAPQVQTTRRAAMPHPLARQLAYTASRNVPKGRKAHPAPVPATVSKRKAASAKKARPVVQNTVKKAQKRRHVWLCNQSRVVRPITGNVVPLNASRTRAVQKPGSQKTIRLLKLAA